MNNTLQLKHYWHYLTASDSSVVPIVEPQGENQPSSGSWNFHYKLQTFLWNLKSFRIIRFQGPFNVFIATFQGNRNRRSLTETLEERSNRSKIDDITFYFSTWHFNCFFAYLTDDFQNGDNGNYVTSKSFYQQCCTPKLLHQHVVRILQLFERN